MLSEAAAKSSIPKATSGRRFRSILSICRPSRIGIRQRLQEVRSARCKDSRDRVYAMLSMISPFDAAIEITSDYTMTTSEVFMKLACQFIKAHNSLNMLTSAGLVRNLIFSQFVF